ncbi:MAG: CoA transferase [Actinomycetota bacterium]
MSESITLLDGWRVVDLTDHRGEVGPYLLADLGADVTRFVADDHDGRDATGDDLVHRTYSANKTVVRLTGDTDTDRATVLDAAAEADLVFASWPDGMLDRLAIDDDALAAANPLIVRTLVTPFGAEGPRAGQPATELTLAALGGPMRLQGIPERAPVHSSVPQVWRHTGAEAALASLVAHRRMRTTGTAQFVDVSAQSAMTWTMLNAMEAHAIQGSDMERAGSVLKLNLTIPLRQPTADGYTICVPTGRVIPSLVDWLIEDGIVDESWRDEDWDTFDHRVISGLPTKHTLDDAIGAVQALCLRYPKQELFERALTVGATMAPLNTVADLLAFEHLDRRRFWTTASVDGANGHPPRRSPGAFLRLNGRRPTVRREAGGHEAAPSSTSRAGARLPRIEAELPFDGLKVVDFSWIGVGPISAKAFADHGATVVRVESEDRIDGLRLQPPFAGGEAGINRSQFFGAFNTSKRSLSLNLKSPEGVGVARRLTDWADVVVESFTPGAIDRLGLGYGTIAETNPSVIMVSTSLLGPGSHVSSMGGYGYHAAAIAGFQELVGWPDLPPDGPYLAYTDTIGPRFIATSIMAALDHRERTGEGCHLDVAQLEVALQLMAPELVRHQIDGRLPPRRGNRAPGIAPQGAYPCRGDDQWLALSVTSDEQWTTLVELMDRPDWALDEALATVEGRTAAHDRIDEHLAAWTVGHDAPALERTMAEHGIAAGTVQSSRQLLADPQYAHRRFYTTLDHDEMGAIPYAGHQYRIRGYDHGPRWAAPCLGADTFEVLTEVLGLDVDEVADIAAGGALA